MKKSNLVFWGILLIDVLTILFFVLKWQVPFKIFGWVSAAVLTIFVLGVVASIKDLKKDLGKAPGFMVAMITIAIVLIGGGFIFTRNILDAILLGCSFSGIVWVLLFAWGINRKGVDQKTSEIAPEATTDGLKMSHVNKLSDEMLEGALRIDSFKIGELFPWKQYVYPGDHITPDINMNGFDVIASFTNLTPKEEQAFATSEIKVSIFEYLGMPFVILNYDDIVRLQFSINVQKMKEWAREEWVKDKDNGYIRVFLLESNDGTLRGIRHFELKMIAVLKRIVSVQLQMEKDDIDGLIRVAEGQFDVRQMEVMAQYTEIVPAPGIEL